MTRKYAKTDSDKIAKMKGTCLEYPLKVKRDAFNEEIPVKMKRLKRRVAN
jgi:hypothetical protein